MRGEIENAPNLCEKLIHSALDIPVGLSIQIIHHSLNTIEFNLIEKIAGGRVLIEIKINNDYGHIFDWLRSNEALQEKIKEALEQAEKTGEAQRLALNIPTSLEKGD